MTQDIFDALQQMRAARRPFAVATVIETRGSVSAKTSSKALIDEQGHVVTGWIGGGCAESATCQAAMASMDSGQTTVLDVDLDDEVFGAGMPCGGHMRIYVEPFLPRPTLWLMGHGRVAECLCSMADMLGIDVVVNDPLASAERFPAASRLVTEDVEYASLNPVAGDFVVVATQHKGDHLSMRRALDSEASYIALIASRKRSRLVLDYLRRDDCPEEQIGRVMAPAGLDLGARTPEEIALSVMSEIVLLRRGGSGKRMRDRVEQGGSDQIRTVARG